jgi:putative methionine-R-sulfoxide reductase with GAF domain
MEIDSIVELASAIQSLNSFTRGLIRDSNLDVKSIHEIYSSVLRQITILTEGCATCIVFVDPDDGEFERIYADGYGTDFQWWTKVSSGQGLLSICFRQHEPIVTDDVQQADHYVQLCTETKSQISLPLRNNEGKTFAALGFEFSDIPSHRIKSLLLQTNYLFSGFFEAIEDLIFSARINNAFEQLDQVAESLDEREALEQLIKAIQNIAGNGEIAVLIRLGGELRVEAYANIVQELLPGDLKIGISTGRGYTCFCAHTRLSFYCKNTTNLERYPFYLPVVAATLSQYTVPLVYRKELVGVLNVGAEIPFAFSYRDRRLLDAFARHASHILFYKRFVSELLTISHKAKQKLESFEFVRQRLFSMVPPNVTGLAEEVSNAILEAKQLIEDSVYPFRERNVADCDLGVLTQDYVERHVRNMAESKGILLTTSGTQAAGLIYRIVRHHFVDILENLLWNAMAAVSTQDDKRIHLTLREEKLHDVSYITLIVENHGRLLIPRDATIVTSDMIASNGELGRPAERRRGIGLWVCDRILAHYGGYLDLSEVRPNFIRAVGYFKK